MNTTIKAIALVAVIAMVAVAFSGDGSDGVGEQFTDGGIVYEVASTSNVTVIGWEGASSEVVIPAEVEYNGRTMDVTRIGEEAFMGSPVTSVDFSQATNLTQIQAKAFYGLDIADVVLPESLTTLGSDAFSCNDAVQSVEIPSKVTSYSHSFSRCSSLTEITVDTANRSFASNAGVLMNDDGDTIYQYPAGKTGLYTIPADVDTIASYAFSGSQITRMEITSSVSTIGAGAFSYCDSLSQFTVSSDNRSFAVSSGVLLSANSTQLVAYPAGKAGTEYSIPSRVTAVIGSAFAGSSLQTVTFPSSVDSVGDYAFADSALTSLTLNSGLNDIGVGAFSGCVSLSEATIPSSVTSISESSFEGCTSLRSVTWSATGSASIGISAFYGCTSLAAVSIPDSVTTVGDQAFAASGLTEVTVPGCRSMGDGVFESCRSLGSVTIADDVAMIPEGIFSGCSSLDEIVFGEDPSLRTIEAQAFAGTAFTAFTIPEGVTTVDATAFSGCTALQTVGIPSTLRDMGERPFEGCSSLTSFTVSADSSVYASVDGVLYSKDLGTLVRYPSAAASAEFSVPEGTETISAGAFEHAGSLTTVEIPQSVTTIGAEAFLGCSGLRSVAIASQELTVGDGAFDLSAGGDPVSVEIFTDAPEFPQSAFGEGTTVTYDEYKNYGLPDSDEIMGDALIWIVAAIVLGVIFLAVHIVVKRS